MLIYLANCSTDIEVGTRWQHIDWSSLFSEKHEYPQKIIWQSVHYIYKYVVYKSNVALRVVSEEMCCGRQVSQGQTYKWTYKETRPSLGPTHQRVKPIFWTSSLRNQRCSWASTQQWREMSCCLSKWPRGNVQEEGELATSSATEFHGTPHVIKDCDSEQTANNGHKKKSLPVKYDMNKSSAVPVKYWPIYQRGNHNPQYQMHLSSQEPIALSTQGTFSAVTVMLGENQAEMFHIQSWSKF